MPAFTPGLRLQDRYELEQLIGAGGMSQVWRANDHVLGRRVAVKTLTGAIAADDELRAGVRREARAAAGLSHPYITAVYDYAEHHLPDGDTAPYLVMELLTGETVAERLAAGLLTWAQAAAVARQIGEALAAAHAQGIVHRDIKPGNVMLTRSGVKVLDFGIAQMSGHRDPTGDMLTGTPSYAAPEVLQGTEPDPAADVYALGALLVEMVTGAPPLPAGSWEEAARLHADPPPALRLPGAPASAVAAVRAALDPSPQHRPTAEALAQQLAVPGPVTSPTLVTPLAGPISGAAKVGSPPTRQDRPPPEYRSAPKRATRRRVPMLAVAFITVMVLLGAALVTIAVYNTDRNDLGGPVSSPTVTASSSAGTPSQPAPERTGTGQEGLADLLSSLAQDVVSGDLSVKRFDDLRKKLEEILERWQRERWRDVEGKSEDLREDVGEWAEDGEISSELAERLDRLLKQVSEAARQRRG